MSEMTNITTAPAAELAPVPAFDGKGYAVAVFEPFRRQISKAKREAAKVEEYDITTTAGMGRAKELRAMFRDIRTSVENVRKDRKAPIIEAGKLLDARAAEIKAEVEPFENKYDAEIKAEEQRKEAEKQRKLELERARVESIQNCIADIRNAPGRVASADSVTINQEINQWTILRLDPKDYEEYLEDALTAVNTTLEQLETLLAAAKAREAEAKRIAEERAELAKLKAEQEAREKLEREAAAERERLARIEREKAADREADLQRQLAEMKAVMEALQRPASPPPAAPVVEVPLVTEGDPVTLGVDLAAPDGDETAEWMADVPTVAEIKPEPINSAGQYYSTTTFRDDGKPILCNADGTRSIFCDVDQGGRPDNSEILDVLAAHYGESPATVLGWLHLLVKEVTL